MILPINHLQSLYNNTRLIFNTIPSYHMSIEDQQQLKFIEPQVPSSQLIQDSQVKLSPFKDEYLKRMAFNFKDIHRDQLLRQLKRHHIYEEEVEDRQPIFIVKINTSKYGQMIEVDIKLGCLLLKIRVINIQGESPLHSINCLSSGSFGKIYKYQLGKSTKAIKCFQVINREKLQNYLSLAIIQYGFLKIAAAIQSGPNIKLDGFDIFVYKKQGKSAYEDEVKTQYCIEFQTQCCDFERPFTHQDKESLFKSLYCLHILRITHCDIKPDNIMFSPTYSKWIFIDFGVTAAIHESIGQRTKTKYRGTLKYSGEEMKKVYSTMIVKKQHHLQDFIDLYWNDVHGLEMTCIDIQKRNKNIGKKMVNSLEQAENIRLKQYFLMLDFKYCLYFGNEHLEQYYIQHITWDKQKMMNMVYFLFQLKYLPEKTRSLFANFLQTHAIGNMELKALNNILAQIKSSLNYNQDIISIYQEEIKPKYIFFKEIADSIQVMRLKEHKNDFLLKMDQKNQIDNAFSFLSNYNNAPNASNSKDQQGLYYTVLFQAVNFTKLKHDINTLSKIEFCKTFYQLEHGVNKQLPQGLEYIKYFITKALSICLSQIQSPLKDHFVQIYQNYLILGMTNEAIIKKVYSTVLNKSTSLSKTCQNFLQLYSCHFWIDEQIFQTEQIDYIALKQYILSIMYSIYQKIEPNEEQTHKDCNKSDHPCLQMQQIMLKRIEQYSLNINPHYKSKENAFEQKIRKCMQVLKQLKITYLGVYAQQNVINEIPPHMKNFYIWQFYALNTESWARITFHLQKMIDSAQISERWAFVLKKNDLFKFHQNTCDRLFAQFQQKMCLPSFKKNFQRMRTYYQIIMCDTYAQSKTMPLVQVRRDKLIRENSQTFIKHGHLYSAQQLTILLVKLGELQSRFIWNYLSLIKDMQYNRVCQILNNLQNKIQSQRCLVKKEHKLFKLRQFIISHNIKLPKICSNNESIILQGCQQNQLLQIKLKYIEQKILALKESPQLKRAYLLKLYVVMQRNNRYRDFLLKNIFSQVYLDLISLLISESRSQQAISVICKLSQNLLYLLSKQTSIITTKIKDKIFDLFITRSFKYFKYWLSFRNQFVKCSLTQHNSVLIFYYLVVGMIELYAFDESHSYYNENIPKLVLPNGFSFMRFHHLKKLALGFTKLLNYRIPGYQIYELQNYYRLVRFLVLLKDNPKFVMRRYKKYVTWLHFKALLATLPEDIEEIYRSKKDQILRSKDYHIGISIYRISKIKSRFNQNIAKQMFKQKIDNYIHPFQEIITKKIRVSK